MSPTETNNNDKRQRDMEVVMQALKQNHNDIKWKWARNRRPIRIHEYKALASGVDGAVYDINKNKRYVVKIMTDRDAFDMEKYVGLKPGIKTKGGGVRVHGYTTYKRFFVLIIDHTSFGSKDVAFTVPVKQFLRKYATNTGQYHAFLRLFATKLKGFYTTVQGFHGDLHTNNVVVSLDKAYRVVNVVILDYSRFVPFDFSDLINGNSNLRTMLDVGHRSFLRVTRNLHFNYLGVPRRAFKKTRTKNPSASNRNMLESSVFW